MTRVVVVVQARTGSTRLPGKVLMPVAGAPVLLRQLERVQAARTQSEVVVATTTAAADDPIWALAREAGFRVVRGHPTDLIDRHVQAAREARGELVVKIPSDCPLIDPAAIDRVIGRALAAAGRVDFVTNLQPPTWPDGHDVEAMPLGVLEIAWREARRPFEREHTTPFIWDQPDRFRVENVRWETGLDFSATHRFTLDYADDYALIAAVYDELYSPGRVFPLAEILALLEERPDLRAKNAMHLGRGWTAAHRHELRTLGGAPDATR